MPTGRSREKRKAWTRDRGFAQRLAYGAVQRVRTRDHAVEAIGEKWPQYAHPRRPEFLLTLPHKHRTSGFFVARLHP